MGAAHQGSEISRYMYSMSFRRMSVQEFMRPNSRSLVHPVPSFSLDHSVISLSLRHVGVKGMEFM
jgi:hypothetical protein